MVLIGIDMAKEQWESTEPQPINIAELKLDWFVHQVLDEYHLVIQLKRDLLFHGLINANRAEWVMLYKQ